MKDRTDLAYEKESNTAQFRENYRFIFSIAIIATVFVIPSSTALVLFAKIAIDLSAFFAALYLISSAARVKYFETGRIYEIFDVSERFRMKMFDWSIDIFGAAFLYFVGLVTTGAIESIPGVNLGRMEPWVVASVIILVIVAILVVRHYWPPSEDRKKKLAKI